LEALGDLIVRHDLAAFLATLVVTNRAVIVAMELVKLDLFRRFDGVVNANWNSDQQKPDVTFPNRSHFLLSPGNRAKAAIPALFALANLGKGTGQVLCGSFSNYVKPYFCGLFDGFGWLRGEKHRVRLTND
jgi:hypothetical protein